MKITLTKSTFYFNDPINLTPMNKSTQVDLDTLSDSVIRKLNLGVITGVINIEEGEDLFEKRVEKLATQKVDAPKEEVIPEPVVEEPTTEEVKTEEVPQVEPVVEEEKPATTRKTTTRKTAAKKA